MFQYADERLALANSVTGHETPEELAQIHAKDKQLELLGVQAKFNYAYSDAWQEQQERMIQKNREQHKRLMDMGSLFG